MWVLIIKNASFGLYSTWLVFTLVCMEGRSTSPAERYSIETYYQYVENGSKITKKLWFSEVEQSKIVCVYKLQLILAPIGVQFVFLYLLE